MTKKLFFGWALSGLFSSGAFAQLTMPKVFGDGRVLQRNQPIPIWGWAAPGTVVSGALGTARAKAVTGNGGQWITQR